MLQDIRYAWRSLRRTPGFTTAALLTLALGIGATTAIFSLVNATLLKPVPLLIPIGLRFSPAGMERRHSCPRLRAVSPSLWPAIVFAPSRPSPRRAAPPSWNLSTPESAISVRGLRVSTDYLKVHGVRPLVGREFTAAEDTPRGPDAAMMSESLAIRLFTDPVSALGRSMTLGGRPYTVVGVLPRDFVSMPSVDVLTPLRTTARDLGVNYRVLGRLRTEITAEAAQAELETSAVRFATGCSKPRGTPRSNVLVDGIPRGVSARCAAAGAHAPRGGRVPAADRLRQRRQPVYRARRRPSSRDRHARVVGCEPGPAGSPGADRVAGAGGRRIDPRPRRRVRIDRSCCSRSSPKTRPVTCCREEPWSLDWRVLLVTTGITVGAGVFFGLAPALALSRLDVRSAAWRADDGRSRRPPRSAAR